MADRNYNQQNRSRRYEPDWEQERNRYRQDNDWSSQRYSGDQGQDDYNRVNYFPDNDENRSYRSRDYDDTPYGTSGTYGYRGSGDYRNSDYDRYRNTENSFNDNDWNRRRLSGSDQGNNYFNEDDWNRRNWQQSGNRYNRRDWEMGSGYSNMGYNSDRDWGRNRYGGDTRNYGNANQGGVDNNWWERTKDKVSDWTSDDDDRRDRDSKGMHRGKGPVNYRRSEDRIREDICDRLTDDDRVDASDISVQLENDVVILQGTVSSREEKRRAEDLVESVSGVRDVENRLRVGGNVLRTHEYTGNTDRAGGIGNESGTTNEIIRDVQEERTSGTGRRRTKNT